MRTLFKGKYKPVTLCALGLLAVMLIALIVNLARGGSLSARERELQAEIAASQKAIDENRSALEYLSSEEYAEWYARTHGKQKDGETVFTGQ